MNSVRSPCAQFTLQFPVTDNGGQVWGGGESTCRLMGWGWDMRAVFEIPGEVFSDIQ
jgi:hypothetical protein